MADPFMDRRSLQPAAAAALRALGVQVLAALDAGARRILDHRARLADLAGKDHP